MKHKRTFFADNISLGSAPCASNFAHAELQAPLGAMLFCPLCAKVWGGGWVDGEATQVRHRPCRFHAPGERLGSSSMGVVSHYNVPGSLILEESRSWNDSLTPECWSRELELTLEWAAHVPNSSNVVASFAQDMLSLLSTNRKGLK